MTNTEGRQKGKETEEHNLPIDTGHCDAFDGIVLLISKEIFEFFKTHSGNIHDNYDDIFVNEPASALQSSVNCESEKVKTKRAGNRTQTKPVNKPENYNNNNLVPVSDDSSIQCSGGKAADTLDSKKSLKAHNRSSDDGSSDTVSSDTVSSGNQSDDSEDDAGMSNLGSREEESESSLRNKALDTLAVALKDKSLCKTISKSLENKNKISKVVKSNSSMSKESSHRVNSSIASLEKTQSDYRLKPSNEIYEKRRRDSISSEVSYSKSPNKQKSPRYSSPSERSYVSSPKSDGSHKYSWKKTSDSWNDSHTNRRNSYNNMEPKPWRNDFRSDRYEDIKHPRQHGYKKNHSKEQYNSYWQ